MNEDEELEDLEEELEKLEGLTAPKPPKRENIFKFFNRILDLVDTTKVGNLTNSELGISKMTVRGNQELAAYAKAEDLGKVAEYLMAKANVITTTSMSRKGFWSQLFVTQIKKEQKLKEPTPEKKKWFTSKTKEGE